MTGAWVVPTARAVEWRPMAVVASVLVLLAAVVALLDRWPSTMTGLLAAAVAAGTVAGLRDPAAETLAAVPTPTWLRRWQRLALLVPVAVAAWLVQAEAGRLLTGPSAVGLDLDVVLALVATGVAVATWMPARGAVPAGAGAPLAWALAEHTLRGAADGVAEAAAAWQLHPWAVTVTALALILIGRNR